MSASVTSPSGVRPSKVAALTVRMRSWTGPSVAGANTSVATAYRLEHVLFVRKALRGPGAHRPRQWRRGRPRPDQLDPGRLRRAGGAGRGVRRVALAGAAPVAGLHGLDAGVPRRPAGRCWSPRPGERRAAGRA